VAGLVLIAWVVSLWMQAPRMNSLAILPLEDLTGDPDQAYLAAGVHEALIAELGSLGIDMISRATMARFADSGLGIPEIATELGVDGVMEGAVLLDGDSLAISARLYDSREEEVWAGSFEGVFPDLIALYRGFARAIAEEIQLRLAPEDEARLTQEPAVNPAVYEPYLRGMTVLHTAGTPQAFQQAIDYFNQAIAADPADALAWAALAQCYVTLGHNQLIDTTEIWRLGRAAALRAIRLDSMSAEGWAALADYETYHGRDWAAAEAAFLRADALNPSLAWNHYHYSWFLVLFGRIEEAVREHQRAVELDPLTPFHTVWMPALHWSTRDFDRAYEEARANIDGGWADNFTANYVLAASAAHSGRHEEAIATAWKMNELRGVVGMLGRVNAAAGNVEEALGFAERLEQPPTHAGQADALAHIYATLGDMEKAMDWLEWEPRSFAQPWSLQWHYFDPLRENPRFQALLREYNLALEPGWEFPVALPPEREGLPAVNGEAGAVP
jgi:TolB-like protein/Tfp pilus assembly protein PilF